MDAKTTKQKSKIPDIGLGKAKRLCQLPESQRLSFIAEGLPAILDSAQGFWKAAQQVKEHHPREARVLEAFAEEEAAKILILMDTVRCPPKLIASKLNKLTDWFYQHLARLIYADAVSWAPMNLAQLRNYVDRDRKGHSIEGHGDYVMPNWIIYERESRLYADVEANPDGSLSWNTPRYWRSNFQFGESVPPALRLAEAMQQLGLFSFKGLKATSEIWGALEYRDKEDHRDAEKMTGQLLERMHVEQLILESAQQADIATLYRDWQLPMYNLDLSLANVTLAELEAEREQEYWRMGVRP